MPVLEPTIRPASRQDVAALVTVVHDAYRGPARGAAWTTEAHLLGGERIDAGGIEAKVTSADGVVLVAVDERGGVLGCCEVGRRERGLAHFGMFAVDPAVQAAGVGRRLLAAAESHAQRQWGSTAVEMTVIAQRSELLAWYGRRGYLATGETRPFPYEDLAEGDARQDGLYFVVLAKHLG